VVNAGLGAADVVGNPAVCALGVEGAANCWLLRFVESLRPKRPVNLLSSLVVLPLLSFCIAAEAAFAFSRSRLAGDCSFLPPPTTRLSALRRPLLPDLLDWDRMVSRRRMSVVFGGGMMFSASWASSAAETAATAPVAMLVERSGVVGALSCDDELLPSRREKKNLSVERPLRCRDARLSLDLGGDVVVVLDEGVGVGA